MVTGVHDIQNVCGVQDGYTKLHIRVPKTDDVLAVSIGSDCLIGTSTLLQMLLHQLFQSICMWLGYCLLLPPLDT